MRSGVLLLAVLLFLPESGAAQGVTLNARIGGTAVALGGDSADGRLWKSIDWESARPGLEWTEIDLTAGALGIAMRVVAVRIDPHLYRFHPEWSTGPNGMTGQWTVDGAPRDAALALNAGQFKETGPWGWVVLDGEETRDPGIGPLSVGIAVTDSGTVRWIPAVGLRAARGDPHIAWAFQTYPLLLSDGRVPALARDGGLVDQDHRDALLLLGERPDGSLLIVLSRFDGHVKFGAAGESMEWWIADNAPGVVVKVQYSGQSADEKWTMSMTGSGSGATSQLGVN